MARRLTGTIAGLLAVASACSYEHPVHERVAVRVGDDSVEIEFRSCRGEQLDVLQLWSNDLEGFAMDDGDVVV